MGIYTVFKWYKKDSTVNKVVLSQHNITAAFSYLLIYLLSK